MRITDILFESQGGIIKRWYESQQNPIYFRDRAGNNYTIANIVQFPQQETVLPINDLLLEVQAAVEQMGIAYEAIKVAGKQPIKQGAATLVVMQNEKGEKFPFMKFFQKRNMTNIGMFWQTSDFSKETGLTWVETRKQGTGKDAQAEEITRIALKPVDAVPVNTDIAIKQVPATIVSKLQQQNPEEAKLIGQLAEMALAGSKDPIPGLAPFERDIQVDLGEVTTPLALVSGSLAGGQYNKVQTDLLAPLGVTWDSASTVFYPEALNEPLFDSIIIWPNGERLRISNKAKGAGGAASLVSIYQTIQKYPERFTAEDRQLLATKYKKYMDATTIISTNTAAEGILRLAVEYGIISQDEAQIVAAAVKTNQQSVDNFSDRLKAILADTRIYAAKTDKPDYSIAYHVFASIAKLVAGYLNQNVEESTEFFRFILSRANLIQVNQFTRRQGDAVGWERFDVVWPPVFPGKIKFDVSNFQANKKPGGRLSFKT